MKIKEEAITAGIVAVVNMFLKQEGLPEIMSDEQVEEYKVRDPKDFEEMRELVKVALEAAAPRMGPEPQAEHTPLKPCPFCGATPTFTSERDVADEFDHSFSIGCVECGYHMADEYESEICARWNGRKSPPESPSIEPQDEPVAPMLVGNGDDGGDPPALSDILNVKTYISQGGIGGAIMLAAFLHAGQLDKSNRPYILHPLRVGLSSLLDTDDERIVGFLHDTVKDTTVTLDQVSRNFPQHIIDAVDALTRRQGETYESFINRVKANEIARKVKIADIKDNLRPGAEHLKDRYHTALAILTNDGTVGRAYDLDLKLGDRVKRITWGNAVHGKEAGQEYQLVENSQFLTREPHLLRLNGASWCHIAEGGLFQIISRAGEGEKA